MDPGKLRDRIDVYAPTDDINDMGERVKAFSLLRSVWANIVPSKGSRNTQGVAEYTAITHKVTVRESALPDIRTDMYFINRGQKLYVEYWYPIYNRKGWMEVFCRAVIE